MNILVTGGYGFIGSHIAERFYKENHHVYIIDNLLTGKKENIDFKHRSFIGDVSDEKCESFFKAHSFEVVIHCEAQTSRTSSLEKLNEDSSSNINGLINMLNLSRKYGVRKFVFCSSANVYSEAAPLPLKEEDKLDPVSPSGINKMYGELYCRKWEEMYGLSSLIFRFSNVYGPRQHLSGESGVVSLYTANYLKQEPVTVFGTGKQTRDFIWIGDAVEAVYLGVLNRLSGTYNISSNTQTSIEELNATLSMWKPPVAINFLEPKVRDIACSQLDNSRLRKDSNWSPKTSLEKGIKATLDYYENIPHTEAVKESKKNSSLWTSSWMHFAENIVLFLMFYVISFVAVPIIEITVFWLIYVLLAALLFGKSQAVFSSVLAVAVHVIHATSSGVELVSLLMDNALLATFIMYLLVGLIVSYVVDRQKIELAFMQDEVAASKGQYLFLSAVYEETLEIKNELHQQILRSDDGINQIYKATRLLDSLEPEALYLGAVHVLEQTLKAKHFALYSIAPNGFAHLVSKSKDPLFMPEASIRINEDSCINKAVHKKKFSFNHSLSPSEPLFVAPIVKQDNTTAVVVCYDVKFQRLTLSYRNLIDGVTHLISGALERSSNYIQEIHHLRYVEETSAMKPAYFLRILEFKQQAADTLHIPYTLLYVHKEEFAKEELQLIGETLRTTDYFGFNEQGKLCIILSNTAPLHAELVKGRLNKKGFEAVTVEGALTNVG